MQIFRTVIHGHRIELRLGSLGGQRLLVNGRVEANRPFAAVTRPSHFVTIKDEENRERHVELRVFDASKLSVGRYRVSVSVDGDERARLEPVDQSRPPNVCRHCGYPLEGLEAERDEVRCPECGRHTAMTKSTNMTNTTKRS